MLWKDLGKPECKLFCSFPHNVFFVFKQTTKYFAGICSKSIFFNTSSMLDKKGNFMLENTRLDFPCFPIKLADLYLAAYQHQLKTDICFLIYVSNRKFSFV